MKILKTILGTMMGVVLGLTIFFVLLVRSCTSGCNPPENERPAWSKSECECTKIFGDYYFRRGGTWYDVNNCLNTYVWGDERKNGMSSTISPCFEKATTESRQIPFATTDDILSNIIIRASMCDCN